MGKKKKLVSSVRLILFIITFLPFSVTFICYNFWVRYSDPCMLQMLISRNTHFTEAPYIQWGQDFFAFILCESSGLNKECELASRYPYGIVVQLKRYSYFDI